MIKYNLKIYFNELKETAIIFLVAVFVFLEVQKYKGSVVDYQSIMAHAEGIILGWLMVSFIKCLFNPPIVKINKNNPRSGE